MREGKRAVWQMGAVVLSTEGLDLDPYAIADNKRSFTGGVFVP